MTLSSALCTVCAEVDAATAGTKTIVETTEQTRVYNLATTAVGGNKYVMTGLTVRGTRYVSVEECS